MGYADVSWNDGDKLPTTEVDTAVSGLRPGVSRDTRVQAHALQTIDDVYVQNMIDYFTSLSGDALQ